MTLATFQLEEEIPVRRLLNEFINDSVLKLIKKHIDPNVKLNRILDVSISRSQYLFQDNINLMLIIDDVEYCYSIKMPDINEEIDVFEYIGKKINERFLKNER
jgi:hypothetical protein